MALSSIRNSASARYRSSSVELEHIAIAYHAPLVFLDQVGKQYFCFYFDQLIAARIDQAKHKTGDAAVRRDDRDITKDHPGGRAGKTRKDDACYQRVGQQAVIRFDSDQQVWDQSYRADRAVADRGKGLHAKEKSAGISIRKRSAGSVDDRAVADDRIEQPEKNVAQKIQQQYQPQKP